MAGGLADHHHAIRGAPVDERPGCRDIPPLLAQAAGLNTLLQDDELGCSLVFSEFRPAFHAWAPVRDVHDDNEGRGDNTGRDSRAAGRHAPLHRDHCC